MRNRNYKGKVVKIKFKKCEEVVRTYDAVQLAYAQSLETREDVYSNAPAFKNFREKYNLSKLKSLFKRKHDPGDISDDEGRWDRVPTKIQMDELLSVDLTPTTSDDVDPDGTGGDVK